MPLTAKPSVVFNTKSDVCSTYVALVPKNRRVRSTDSSSPAPFTPYVSQCVRQLLRKFEGRGQPVEEVGG